MVAPWLVVTKTRRRPSLQHPCELPQVIVDCGAAGTDPGTTDAGSRRWQKRAEDRTFIAKDLRCCVSGGRAEIYLILGHLTADLPRTCPLRIEQT